MPLLIFEYWSFWSWKHQSCIDDPWQWIYAENIIVQLVSQQYITCWNWLIFTSLYWYCHTTESLSQLNCGKFISDMISDHLQVINVILMSVALTESAVFLAMNLCCDIVIDNSSSDKCHSAKCRFDKCSTDIVSDNLGFDHYGYRKHSVK